jgi:hypothetical protein
MLASERVLDQSYHIKVGDVIGHTMVNGSPFFKDLEGRKNDHTDWRRADVLRFRRMLAAWGGRIPKGRGDHSLRSLPADAQLRRRRTAMLATMAMLSAP